MCKCDYEYGGDFIPPYGTRKNPYKLWSLSIYFNTVYVANYLYIIFILIVNEFWEDLLGTNVLNTCYKDTVKYWLLLHFIKPIATMIIVKYCGPQMFKSLKLCLISLFMLIFDITFGALAIYYCWLDLFNIYYQGNKNCNLPSPVAVEQYQYDYNQSSLIFILLSFFAIHFVFIWLELFRFVEIATFQHSRRKLKKNKVKHRANQQKPKNIENIDDKVQHIQHRQHNIDYQSVEMEDLSKSIDDIVDDNKLMDIELSISRSVEISNEGINELIQELYVYGVDREENNKNRDKSDNYNNELEDSNDSKSSKLSHLWKATTMVVTTGFILELAADDFCCVCWEEFEIGHNVAKLICDHILHKKCAVEWFEESSTCPTCRISLAKY